MNDLQAPNDSIIRVGQAKWGRLESESACSVASGPRGGHNVREASMHAHLTEEHALDGHFCVSHHQCPTAAHTCSMKAAVLLRRRGGPIYKDRRRVTTATLLMPPRSGRAKSALQAAECVRDSIAGAALPK